MPQAGEPPATQQAVSSDKAKETLSQFVARVLDQLSLSAWLPAAALILLMVFVVQLRIQLGETKPDLPAPPMRALHEIAGISLGGALLLVGAVIVSTMVTQAFSFEAIRILEGYWGTSAPVERVAQWRCGRHLKRRRSLDERRAALTEQAWVGAQAELQKINDDLVERGREPELSPE